MTPHPFVYPPTFLLLAWPFGQLPFTAADYLWGGLSCAALVLAARADRAAGVGGADPAAVRAGGDGAAYGQSIFFAGAALVASLALIERHSGWRGC